MTLERRLLGFVRARGLLAEKERVLVAISGGVDSVVLLHLLRTIAPQLRLDVVAAHFDHAMRPGSAQDADWVAGLCEAWQVPLVRGRAGRALLTELDARTERYRFLADALQQTRAQRAATAHHADDQVETVLLRLLRGAGLRGLSGIPVRRGPFIRPLLRFTKLELLDYAAAHGIGYRADETNEEPRFLRNRIRALVVPALEDAHPGARAAVLSLARYAARTEAAWHAVSNELGKQVVRARADDKIELAREILLEYHPALRARVLRHYLRKFGVVPGRATTGHILQFCANAQSGAALEIAGRVRIERSFDSFRIVQVKRAGAVEAAVRIEGASGRAALTLGPAAFEVAWSTAAAPGPDAVAFNTEALAGPLELRAWRAGDRIRMPYGTKKLKKLFSERRVPASERAHIPVLTDQQGRVLWVVGLARSVHALANDSQQVLNVTVRNAEFA